MRFVLLGSGAVRNNPRRAGPSQILTMGRRTLLFDCGRSACTRLAQQEVAVEEIDELFLTHLHFDHVVDVAYFCFAGWNNGRQRQLKIFGPSGTREFVDKLLRPPYAQDIASRLGHGKDPFGLDPEVVEIDSETRSVLEDSTLAITATHTAHGGIPTLAYRIDTDDLRVVISGDGLPQPDFTGFAQNADLLVYECSGTAEFLAEHPWGSWHITPEGLAELATDCGAKRVMIKHLVMEDITGDLNAVEEMGKRIRRRFGGEVIVGYDGAVVDLKDKSA